MTVTASSLQNPDIYTDPNKAPEFHVALKNQQQPESHSAKATQPQTLSDILEIDGDGELSQFEINTWREIAQGDIEKLSAGNPDAAQQETIARFKEFLVHLEKHFPEIDSQEILLRDFDTDQNGALSKDEIAQAKTFLQQQINAWVNTGADKTLYVHAQQLMAALTALESDATEGTEEEYVTASGEEIYADTPAAENDSLTEDYEASSDYTSSAYEDATAPNGDAADGTDTAIMNLEPPTTYSGEQESLPDDLTNKLPEEKFYGVQEQQDSAYTQDDASSYPPIIELTPEQEARAEKDNENIKKWHAKAQEQSEESSYPPKISQILEIDKDDILSQFEIDTWREITQADIEKLSAEEPTPEQQNEIERLEAFLVFLEKHSPQIGNEELLIRDYDLDYSGALSSDEIAEAKSLLEDVNNDAIGPYLYTRLDTAHAEKQLAALDEIVPVDEAETTDVMSTYDTDGDGVLSAEEIANAKSELKSAIEKNILDLFTFEKMETANGDEDTKQAS